MTASKKLLEKTHARMDRTATRLVIEPLTPGGAAALYGVAGE